MSEQVRGTPRHQLITFFGLFGDEVERRRALDMSRRVIPVQMIAVAMCALAALTGAHEYGIWPVILILLSEAGFLAAVILPKRLARPELPLVAVWMLGQGLLIAAAISAGDARDSLLAITAISIVFVGVIWTLRLSVVAVLVTLAGLGAAILALTQDAGHLALSLLPTTLLLALTALSASSLRAIDHASRGNVLTDRLTGLKNRIALRDALAAIGTESRAAAVIVLDLDHFKQINDIHGHAVGDSVLVAASTRLEAALAGCGTLFRYGGEELVAVISRRDSHRGHEIAERLRTVLAQTPIGGLTVTASGGVICVPAGHGLSGSHLFQLADAAMYRAKESGRNQIAVADATAESGRGAVREEAGGRPAARAVRAPRASGVRLVSTVVERDQLFEVLGAVRPARMRALSAILVLTGVALLPAFGRAPLAILCLRAVVLDPALRAQLRMHRDSRVGTTAPLVEAMLSMAFIGAAIIAAGGSALPLLSLLALPVLSVSAAYPCKVAALLTAEAGVLSAIAGVAAGPGVLPENPVSVVMPVAIVAAIALVGATIGRSAVDHRTAAIIDPLTGLLNRAALDLRLPEIAADAAAGRTPVSVIVGDLDHFKRINDQHGHATGDEVLSAAATLIAAAVRSVDAVYRVGGEEFVVVLPRTQTGAAAQIAERIRAAIEAEPVAHIPITISLGVAGSPGESFRYSEAFARADNALIDAKRSGRNRVEIAAPALRALAAA